MKKGLCILLLCISCLFSETPEQKGLAINIKADEVNSGYSTELNDMKMILINAHGDHIERRMSSKIKETQYDGDRSAIEFQWPADVKGTRLLTWSHKETDDDQWLYLPAIKRVKRISSTNQAGSFMGSEFSYEDVSSQEVEKFTYKFIKDDVINSRQAWVIDRYPVNVKSGYSKQVTWIDKEYFNPLKIDYYDRKGELLKTSIFSGYTNYNTFWRQSEIKMVNHQTKKQSVLTWTNRRLGTSIPDNEFQKNSLIN